MDHLPAQPIFLYSVRALDVLQRIYMRMVVLITPKKVSRTVFGATMSCDGRDFVQRRIRFFRVFEHNLTYSHWNICAKGTFTSISARMLAIIACLPRVASEKPER